MQIHNHRTSRNFANPQMMNIFRGKGLGCVQSCMTSCCITWFSFFNCPCLINPADRMDGWMDGWIDFMF